MNKLNQFSHKTTENISHVEDDIIYMLSFPELSGDSQESIKSPARENKSP